MLDMGGPKVFGPDDRDRQNPDGVILKVPPPKNDETDRVLVLKLAHEN
jgi:hypothetical protein